MRQPQNYEQVLRAEIEQIEDEMGELCEQLTRLEVRADSLKHALAVYADCGAGAAMTLAVGKKHGSRRGSRFKKVLDHIKEAGEEGLTIEDMNRFAVRSGLKLKRESIRSNVWNLKKSGVLERIGDSRYRTASATTEGNAQPKTGTEIVPEKPEGTAGDQPAESSLKLVGAA